MLSRIAVVVSFALFHIHAGAADKLEHKSSSWSVFSSVDRMSDQTECYARSKQGLYMCGLRRGFSHLSSFTVPPSSIDTVRGILPGGLWTSKRVNTDW